MKLEFSKFSEIVNDPCSNVNVEQSLIELYKVFKHKLSKKHGHSQRKLMFGEFQHFLTKKVNKHPHLPILGIISELRYFYPSKFNHESPAPFIVYQKEIQELSKSHKYILSMLKKHKFDTEIIDIMRRFFSLEDEMNDNLGPSWFMIDYLRSITKAFHRILLDKNVRNIEKELFVILIRYNFNKEDVYLYCVKRIDVLLKTRKTRRIVLDVIDIECSATIRTDIYYNKKANSLATDIQGNVEKRRRYLSAEENGYYPLEFNEPSGVYVGIINLFVKIDFMKPLGTKGDLHDNLRKITRGPNNKQYDITTIKNGSRLNKINDLLKAKEIFTNGINMIDKLIEKNRR